MADLKKLDFNETVKLIVREDARFDAGAYHFIRAALDHTVRALKKRPDAAQRTTNHVSGPELLEGVRDYALQHYGPMAAVVLEHWRVRRCSDFGEIVFNLIDYGVFSKTENDKREDFADLFDFQDAFVKPFLPKRRLLPRLVLAVEPV